MSRNSKQDPGRRSFLQTSGAAFGLFVSEAFANAQELKPKAKAKVATPEAPPTPVTCAVIGAGDQGREILKALAALPGADVKMIADSYAGIHKRALERHPKATAVEDYRKVLDDKAVQAVWVATPTHQHKEIVLAALQAGKHVYVETPLAHTVDDARAIAQAGLKNPKLVFQAGLQRRLNPLEEHVFGFFRTGVLSHLAMGRAHWSKKNSWRKAGGTPEREKALNWRLDKKISPGLVGEIGIHQIDIASLFLRSKPAAISGFGAVMAWKDGREVADTIHCTVEFANGFHYIYTATLGNSFEADRDVFQGSDAAIMLHKDRAWLFKESDAPNLGWEVYATKENLLDETGIALVANATKLLDEGKDPSENRDAYTKGPTFYACETFLNAVRGKGKSKITSGPAEGFQATMVALKANEAITTGNRVVFKNEWFNI